MEHNFGESIYVIDETKLTKKEKLNLNKDNNKNKSEILLNIFVNLFIFGLAIWIGGSIIRSAIIYDIYEPTSNLTLPKDIYSDLALKQNTYTDNIRLHAIYLYSNTSIYTNVAYILSLVSGIFLLFFNIRELKQKGWLFMSLLLLLFSAPVEIFNMYCDYQLNYVLKWDGGVLTFFDGNIQKYAIERFTNLLQRTFGVMSFLSAITTIIFFVWKPLEGTNKIKNIDNTELK